MGYVGIEAIQNSKYANKFATDEVYSAFEKHHQLQETQAQIAKDMGIDAKDPKVIEALFSNPENIELAKRVAIDFAFNEQTIVQPLYTDEVFKAPNKRSESIPFLV